jgi:hypothetical protein
LKKKKDSVRKLATILLSRFSRSSDYCSLPLRCIVALDLRAGCRGATHQVARVSAAAHAG